MIDTANTGLTSYGTRDFATKQVVDATAVSDVLGLIFITGERFVAIASGATAAYSTDGITWTPSTIPGANYWNSIAYGQ
jgi:hypothetical protein